MGTTLPSPKGGGGGAPQFSAHVYCSQTAGWMKVVLGMEVGLSPDDFVLDGDPVPFPQNGNRNGPKTGEEGSASPIFGPFLL